MQESNGELRYSRHELLPQIGPSGQAALRRGVAVIVGLGALGSTAANLLSRAGVGTIRLVDRDLVEWSNLQRQCLYDESDAKEGVPKVLAAERHLKQVNSEVNYEALVQDMNPMNVEDIIKGATVVIDGLDNFYSRALLNQACVKHGIPWIHGACISTHGVVMTVIPGETACYNCLAPDADRRVSPYTCDTAGVFSPSVSLVASIQSAEAIKILAGNVRSVRRGEMLWFDPWENVVSPVQVKRNPSCQVCGKREFPLLEKRELLGTTSVCGRNAVQVTPDPGRKFDFEEKIGALKQSIPWNALEVNDYLAKFSAEGVEIVLFRDGRAMVFGTSDPVRAKSIYVRYIGG